MKNFVDVRNIFYNSLEWGIILSIELLMCLLIEGVLDILKEYSKIINDVFER